MSKYGFLKVLSLAFFLPPCGAVYCNEPAAPGKQVVETIELPASTSTWDYGQGVRLIGEPRPLDESKTDTVRYWLYLPLDYEKATADDGAPLFLFLHGAGERGSEPDDIAKVKVHGPPKLLDKPEFRQHWPCVTVSPQCKNGFAWSPAQLLLLLDAIETKYKIDKKRVYVSGLSMGGFGTWMLLQAEPARFAAAAPICGGAKAEWAPKLVDIPIWCFHGNKDAVVPHRLSEIIVDAVRKAGGRKVILTVYEGVGHDSWTSVYDNQLLYDWMFAQ